MRFLITNDDGYDAPGLVALYRALRPMAQIAVVAPREEQSTRGHAVTFRDPVAVEWIGHELFGRTGVVGGFPADCTRIGLAAGLGPFDWIVSGVNHGANLGVDAFYSGTVAAAREAALQGYPAIAISQLVQPGRPTDWSRTIAWTQRVIEEVLQRPRAERTFWNVNLPALDDAAHPARVRTVRLSIDPVPVTYEISNDGGSNRELYRYSGVYHERPAAADTDVEAVFNGDIAVTPIRIDSTCLTHQDAEYSFAGER